MRRYLSSFRRSRRATAAIEFAIIVPVLLLFMAGTVELGRGFQAYRAVNQLAARYASTWADCSDNPVGTCNTLISTYTSPVTIQNLVPQLTVTASNPSVQMIMYQMASGVPAVVYPAGATMTADQITAAQNAYSTTQSTGNNTIQGVVVTVSYTHNLIFFQSLMSGITAFGKPFKFTVAQDKS